MNGAGLSQMRKGRCRCNRRTSRLDFRMMPHTREVVVSATKVMSKRTPLQGIAADSSRIEKFWENGQGG